MKFLRTIQIAICLLLMVFSFQGTAAAASNTGDVFLDKNPLGGYYQRGLFVCNSSGNTFSADFSLQISSGANPIAPNTGFDYAASELYVNGKLQYRVDPRAASRMNPPRIAQYALAGYFDHIAGNDDFRRGYVYTKSGEDAITIGTLKGSVLTSNYGFMRYRNNKGFYGIQVSCPTQKRKKEALWHFQTSTSPKHLPTLPLSCDLSLSANPCYSAPVLLSAPNSIF